MVTAVVSGVTQSTIVSSDQTTIVKQVIVGTPVRRVSSGGGGGLGDLDLSNLENGSLLIYNSVSSKWVAKKDIEEGQDIDGGNY
jgi:hypothetical protein